VYTRKRISHTWEARKRRLKEDAGKRMHKLLIALTHQGCGFGVAASPRQAADFDAETEAI